MSEEVGTGWLAPMALVVAGCGGLCNSLGVDIARLKSAHRDFQTDRLPSKNCQRPNEVSYLIEHFLWQEQNPERYTIYSQAFLFQHFERKSSKKTQGFGKFCLFPILKQLYVL